MECLEVILVSFDVRFQDIGDEARPRHAQRLRRTVDLLARFGLDFCCNRLFGSAQGTTDTNGPPK